MFQVNVLDQPANWRVGWVPPFWYPVFLNRRDLRQEGLRFRFFSALCDGLFEGDALFLSSRFFHLEGRTGEEKERSLEKIAAIKQKVATVLWFDLRDSSGNTQFEVLPHVSKYLKKQLLRDRGKYCENLYGNRVYTDYFYTQYGVEDSYEEACIPLPTGGEAKLEVSWNVGLHDNRGGGKLRKLLYLISDRLEAQLGLEHRMGSCDPGRRREVNLVALFQKDYDRNTIAFQRRRAAEMLADLKDRGIVAGPKVPRGEFRKLLCHAKMVLSLFGWGEICFRDFESFMAGAALLMPDVSHLETWPELHVAYETYWPLKWDLSDLVESYHHLMGDENARIRIAKTGWERHRRVWKQEGREGFCRRLKGIVQRALDADR